LIDFVLRSELKRGQKWGGQAWSILKNQMPLKTDQWDEHRPGFVAAETVAQCGNSQKPPPRTRLPLCREQGMTDHGMQL